MKILFLLPMILTVGMWPGPQAQIAVVTPIRVAIESEAEEGADDQFHRAFRRELNKLRDVVIVREHYDLDLFLAATELTEKGQRIGYAASALVISREHGKTTLKFLIATGPTLEATAAHLADRIDREHLETRRR